MSCGGKCSCKGQTENVLVFDDFVKGAAQLRAEDPQEISTKPMFNPVLGKFDTLTFQAVATWLTGSMPLIYIDHEMSADEINWLSVGAQTSFSAEEQETQYIWGYSVTSESGAPWMNLPAGRLVVSSVASGSGENSFAHVRIWASVKHSQEVDNWLEACDYAQSGEKL